MTERKKVNVSLLSVIVYLCFNSGCGKSVVDTKTEDSLSKYSSLNRSSNPSGAEIYIDGKKSGYVTPYKVEWLGKKNIVIKLILDPYYAYEVSLITGSLADGALFYDFEENDLNFGTVVCGTKQEGASVYINGTIQEAKHHPHFGISDRVNISLSL